MQQCALSVFKNRTGPGTFPQKDVILPSPIPLTATCCK